jgi:hypothetical protein
MATHIPINNADGWVRLVYLSATIALDRWPGPHGPGSVIHASGGGCFVFDHHDHGAANGPEAIYVWAPTS